MSLELLLKKLDIFLSSFLFSSDALCPAVFSHQLFMDSEVRNRYFPWFTSSALMKEDRPED